MVTKPKGLIGRRFGHVQMFRFCLIIPDIQLDSLQIHNMKREKKTNSLLGVVQNSQKKFMGLHLTALLPSWLKLWQESKLSS
jgi:hypothetical protein